MKEIDTDRIERAVRELLIALNDDPDRAGLKDTPKRVAGMFKEMYEGMCYTNDEIAEKFSKVFEENVCDDMVVVGNIPIFSNCEHHMALMYDMRVDVAYLPKNKVIGISKIARIADMVAKRLQLQERIGQDIAEILSKILETEDIAVIIQGKHSCMTARGIKKDSMTRTSVVKGKFRENPTLRAEMLAIIKGD